MRLAATSSCARHALPHRFGAHHARVVADSLAVDRSGVHCKRLIHIASLHSASDAASHCSNPVMFFPGAPTCSTQHHSPTSVHSRTPLLAGREGVVRLWTLLGIGSQEPCPLVIPACLIITLHFERRTRHILPGSRAGALTLL